MRTYTDYSTKHPDVTGNTLAKRTRERNWLIKRLHGAQRFAAHLGFERSATEYKNLILYTKAVQKDDKRQELYLRKEAES